MELTKRQSEGLDIALKRFKDREKYTCISGYAGSGKSTLVKFIVAALGQCGIDPDKEVCYASFTGKAAQVLLKKGNKNVLTLHKLLYQSIPKPDGTFYRKPKQDIKPFKIVIVDEVSMAPKTLMDLLFSHNVYVICLGDPFQLPPVEKKEDNHLLDRPHIFLDEIMRQAQESEIIRLSMKIRNEEKIEYCKGEEVIVLPEKELNTGMLLWADQVICATNQNRILMNNEIRNLLGREGMPRDGDKVICLRNYWDYCADNGDPLVNGTIGFINNSFDNFYDIPRYMGGGRVGVVSADFLSDSDANFKQLNMDKKQILTGEKALDWKTEYKLKKNPKTAHLVPLEFTYGYAITCHKAQGSEWEKGLILEEGFPFAREEHARWLYTAVTRMSEKVVLKR